ncbi:MAG: O-antigen ligase family protein, partial [Gammaproteobacteria bacterium]|nr:O-antigen ligase family protein [Gammaproteobacteria bacterium]
MASSTHSAAIQSSAGYWIRLIILGIVAGFVVTALLPVVAEASRRSIALGIIGIGIIATVAASRRGREVLLFVWIVALTYNRQFWSFAPIVGDHGAFGPYWMIADLALLALLVYWAFEVVILKIPQQPKSLRLMPWYGPFAIAAALSVVGAPEPAWALGDLSRIAKLGLVLLYFRYNVGPRQWWVIIAGLGAAVAIQSGLGILEVVSGRTGVLGIFGISDINVQESLGINELFGGWTRATGTVAHPPYLAAFFLLTVPIFMSLALTLPINTIRLLCIGVTGLGAIGMICTLTRMPIAVMLAQTVLLVTLLTAMRQISIMRIVALIGFTGLAVGLIGILGAELILERLTSDLKASVDERFEGYATALKMLGDHPLFGVGLNNYGAVMEQYDPSTAWGITDKWQRVATQITHMRLLAGPLNGYLYVASVTGLVGLAAFLWLALGGIVLGSRAIKRNRGASGS